MYQSKFEPGKNQSPVGASSKDKGGEKPLPSSSPVRAKGAAAPSRVLSDRKTAKSHPSERVTPRSVAAESVSQVNDEALRVPFIESSPSSERSHTVLRFKRPDLKVEFCSSLDQEFGKLGGGRISAAKFIFDLNFEFAKVLKQAEPAGLKIAGFGGFMYGDGTVQFKPEPMFDTSFSSKWEYHCKELVHAMCADRLAGSVSMPINRAIESQLNLFIKTIASSLEKKGKASIQGFGSFSILQQAVNGAARIKYVADDRLLKALA